MKFKPLPELAQPCQVNAAYTILTSAGITPEKAKELVVDIWETMAASGPPVQRTAVPVRQKRVLDAIIEYIDEHGTSPSYRKIAELVGIRLSNAYYVVLMLERRGILKRAFISSGGKRRPNGITVLVRNGEPVKYTIRGTPTKRKRAYLA